MCEHAHSLQHIPIFTRQNKFIGLFCVLSTILLKIQIVTNVSGTLQLPDFFHVLDEELELNTNWRIRSSFGECVEILIAVTMWHFFVNTVFTVECVL